MSYNSDALELLKQFMNKLDKRETKEMLLMARKWEVVSQHLDGLINDLSLLDNLSEDKLYKLSLYKEFLAESKKQVNKFNLESADLITENQKVFGTAGIELTQAQISLVKVNFGRMSVNAVNNMIGLTSDGTKLSDLLLTSYPQTIDRLKNTLIESTAMGRNPMVTAKLMKDDMDGNIKRARVIARTEQLRVLRETSTEQMIQSGVVTEKERIEQPDCCDECDEVNGQRFDLDEDFDTHPNCRGNWLPIVE